MSLNSPTLLNEENSQGPKRNTERLESLELQSPSSFQDNPLQQLQLASQEVLEKAKKSGRSKCPRCSSSRMFYCYTCFVPVETVPIKEIPTVKLPLKIDIIKHPNETDGKSTAVHAKLLAPDDVTIYKYPCIPEYEEKRHEIALIFPGPDSVSVKDIAFHLQKYTKKSVCDDDCSREPFCKQAKRETKEEEKNLNECISSNSSEGTRLKKIIFIDSTWNQTNKIITDERLQALILLEVVDLPVHYINYGEKEVMEGSEYATGFSTVAANRVEDKENLLLASSEGKARYIPFHNRSNLLFPCGLSSGDFERELQRTI